MFEIRTQICKEYAKIRDLGYMEEFLYEDFFLFFFIYLLIINFNLNCF